MHFVRKKYIYFLQNTIKLMLRKVLIRKNRKTKQ